MDMDEEGDKLTLPNFFSSKPSEDEVLSQLKSEGILSTLTPHGNVAFDVRFDTRRSRTRGAPRRLARLGSPTKRSFKEEKILIAAKNKGDLLEKRIKMARREEEKRRKVLERKRQQQLLLQSKYSERLTRKMTEAESRRKELTLIKLKVLPPIEKHQE